MATDHIRYDVLARDALRGVLRRVLTDAAEHGLPGEHHFFITFLSAADGVKLSPRLLAQYPEEMTIILQHQFWDLVVTEDRFEVGLSFGNIPERLVVPFAAIKSFLDPSVQFGLQFEPSEALPEAPAAKLPEQLPEVVKAERRERLMAVQQDVAFAWNAAQAGRSLDVLVDAAVPGERNAWIGRSYADAPDVDGVVYVSGKGIKIGSLVRCEVVGSSGYDLVAAAVGPAR